MALEPTTSDPLDRALQAAREETPEGWVEISQSVMSRVRALISPSKPVLTFTEGGDETRDSDGSRTYVSSRVVVAVLRRLLQGSTTHAPDRIDLDVDDARLVGVRVAVVGTYGIDLRALAATMHAEILEQLHELLGPDPAWGPSLLEIEITDVVAGDPNRV